EKALTRLHRHPRRELTLRIAEGAGAFDHRRDDRRAVHRQNQLARRRGDARSLVARLEFLRRRIWSRETGAPSAACALAARGRRPTGTALCRLVRRRTRRTWRTRRTTSTSTSGATPSRSAGSAGNPAGGQVRVHVFGASEVGDA